MFKTFDRASNVEETYVERSYEKESILDIVKGPIMDHECAHFRLRSHFLCTSSSV